MKSLNTQQGRNTSVPMWRQMLAERGILEQGEKAGWVPGGNGWTYPVFDPEGNPLKSPEGSPIKRWKNFSSHLTPKYLWKPVGVREHCPRYYLLPGTNQAILDNGGRVYIASGEPDVLAYHAAGYANVLCWFDGEESVPATLAEDLLKLGVREAIYYPDLDPTGTSSVEKVAQILHGSSIAFRAYKLPAELGAKGDINRLWKHSGFDRAFFQISLSQLSSLSIEIVAPDPSMGCAQYPKAVDEARQTYAKKALDSELGILSGTDSGRNNQLNASGYALGQLIGAGYLDRSEVEAALLDAARSIGLSNREAQATIKSGLDAGRLVPRDLSEIGEHEQIKGRSAPAPGAKLTVLSRAPATANNKYVPLCRADLEQLPRPEWLIPNLIQARTLVTLFGRSGSGKSFLALELAMRVAQTGPAIYVAGEGLYGYLNRLNAWRKFNKQDEGNLHFIRNPIPMLDPAEVKAFIAAVMPLAPRLIILDTLSRCMVGGDENSSKDMGLFVEACAEIQRATGATILVIHHTGKNGIGERGSSVLRCACETMIELSKDEGYITLSCDKMKDAPEFNPCTFQLLPVALDNGDSSCVMVPSEKVVQTLRDPLTRNQRQLLEALSLEVFVESGAKTTALIQTAEVSGGSVYRVLSVLKRLGYVRQAQSGDPYFITSEGLAALGKTLPPSSPSPAHHDGIDGSPHPEAPSHHHSHTPFRGANDASDGRGSAKINSQPLLEVVRTSKSP